MKFVTDLPQPILRLFIVFVVFFGLTLFTRFFVIPSSLTDRDFHKASATEREMAKTVHYAGSSVCVDCHDDKYEEKSVGYHQNLSCETCHGPASEHANADSPDENLPIAPSSREFCPICHNFDQSRPTGFPQIKPAAHNPGDPCVECHDPHNPEPPEVPEKCTACHGNIGLIKTVSTHSELECTVCHTTPEEHKITPREVKPSKPTKREACGVCHDKSSDYADAPKVSINTHEEKYLCWQCHFPHMPKVTEWQEEK